MITEEINLIYSENAGCQEAIEKATAERYNEGYVDGLAKGYNDGEKTTIREMNKDYETRLKEVLDRVDEKDKEIKELKKSCERWFVDFVKKRDKVEILKKEIKELEFYKNEYDLRSKIINDLEQEAEHFKKILSDNVDLNQQLKEKDKEIKELESVLQEHYGTMQDINKICREKDKEIQQIGDNHCEFLQKLAEKLNIKLNKDLIKTEKEIMKEIINKDRVISLVVSLIIGEDNKKYPKYSSK